MKILLKKIWQLFTPVERYKAGWMLMLCALMALAETFGVVSIMPFLAALTRPAVIHENVILSQVYRYFDFENTQHFILMLGVFSIVFVAGSSAFKTLTLHILNRFVHFMRHSISTRLLTCYLRQPYEFFLANNPSILSKRLLSETDQLISNLLIPVSQLLAQGVVVLAIVVLIFCYDALMACSIVAVVTVLYGLIYGLVRKHLRRIGQEWQMSDSERYQSCNEVLGGIKDVKITHSAPVYMEKYGRALRQFSRHMAMNDTVSQSPLYIVEATGYTGLIVIAIWLLLKTNDASYVLPTLGLYGFAAYRLLPAMQIMYRGFSRLQFAVAILDSISHDLDLPDRADPVPSGNLAFRHGISLEQAGYAYPSAPEKRILSDFNLIIPANSSVGISGKSGHGKSTLMDILLGLLPLQEGRLCVDGVPVTQENAAAWQAMIGYVPQHIFLSDTSLLENIAFGISREKIDRAAVERAARAAQIHDFIINELPQGYETLTGDRGIRLSGGQRQRIGIARALYRDPPVLFMDEATSALDADTEEAVNEAIRVFSGKKTIVVIAHKESSLRYCQKIINLEKSY